MHHRLVESQIYGEFVSEEAVLARGTEDPNFVDQQGRSTRPHTVFVSATT